MLLKNLLFYRLAPEPVFVNLIVLCFGLKVKGKMTVSMSMNPLWPNPASRTSAFSPPSMWPDIPADGPEQLAISRHPMSRMGNAAVWLPKRNGVGTMVQISVTAAEASTRLSMEVNSACRASSSHHLTCMLNTKI